MDHSIRKEIILDIVKKQGKESAIDHVMQYIKSHGISVPSVRGVRKNIDTCIKVEKTYKKKKGRVGNKEAYEEFMQQDLPIPTPKQLNPVPFQHDQGPSNSSAQSHGRHEVFMEAVYKETHSKLADEMKKMQEEHRILQVHLKESNEAKDRNKSLLQKKSDELENIKHVKRRHICLLKQEKITGQKNKILTQRLEKKRVEFRRLSSSNSYLQRKIKKISILRLDITDLTSKLKDSDLVHQSDMMTIEELKQSNADLLAENEWLREMVQEDNEITTFHDGCYSTEMQQCVHRLLENHVSVRKVAGVIEAVLKLARKKASHLPSRTTVTSMNVQRLILAQKQIAEEFAGKTNTTLLSDETTKHTTKLEGMHAADGDGRIWVLGLRELLTKSANDVYKVFQDILEDVDDRALKSENKTSQHILANISSRLSDRAATELKFGEMLEEARKEILPIVRDGFSDMSLEEQTTAGRIIVFSCGLHSLIHFAECCASGLLEVEQGLLGDATQAPDPTISQKGEPGTIRLIRTACKAFVRGADMKNGCHIMFAAFIKPFLKEHNLKSLPLAPFKGNRFNIVFTNGGHLFFLRKKMMEYLEGNATNRLLRAVLHDLKCPEYIAGCKAMGLLSKYLTTPLWNVLEDKDLHIMDLSSKYCELLDFIKRAAVQPQELMAGNLLPFGESTIIKNDCFLHELQAPFPHDDKVHTILGVILPALAKLTEKLFADLLPGGCHFNAGLEVRNVTKGTPKHNKFAESVFAYVDNLMVSRPNISTLACEAYVMYANNHTSDWLYQKSPKETAHLLTEARKDTKRIRQTFQSRHHEIQKARLLAVKEKLKQAQEAERKKVEQLEQYTSAIIHHGLWQSLSEVENMLGTYSTSGRKVEALKAQLRFRQQVLRQQAEDSTCYNFSRKDGGKRKNLTWQELANNLKSLVATAASCPEEESNIYVGRRIRHRFVESDAGDQEPKEVWYHGKVISQLSNQAFRKCIQQSNSRQVSSVRGKLNERNTRPRAYILLVIPAAAFALGTWQVKRRKWKLGLIQDLEDRTHALPIPFPDNLEELKDLEYRRVVTRGAFDHSREIHIEPRANLQTVDEGGGLVSGRSSSGAHIITPFTLADRDLTILINRGWVPRDHINPKRRPQGQVEGNVDLVGVVRLAEKRQPMGISNNPAKGVWFHRDLEAMSETLGTAPVFLDADKGSTIPGGPVGGQTRVTLRNEHFSYIITWYSLALITSFMWYKRYIAR